jgi:hypothetical protein
MTDYLFIVNVGDDIVNSIIISSIVPNRRMRSIERIDFKLGVYMQKKSSTQWKKMDEIFFSDSNNIKLSSCDYDMEVGQLAVIIPVDIGFELGDNLSALPEPISRKTDTSPVNERAMISFRRGNSESSYQGEFPYLMSKIKGTFLAFDSLTHNRGGHVKNKLVFINIFSQELLKKESFNLFMVNSVNKECVKEEHYEHNSAAIMNFNCKQNYQYAFYSKDTLGIPIFISYSDDNSNLSVEHTHPPSEFFYGDNKFSYQQKLKSNWLSKLP